MAGPSLLTEIGICESDGDIDDRPHMRLIEGEKYYSDLRAKGTAYIGPLYKEPFRYKGPFRYIHIKGEDTRVY